MKLKSSIIIIASMLLVNRPESTTARRAYNPVIISQDTENQTITKSGYYIADTIRGSAEAVMKMVVKKLPGQDPSSLNSYSAVSYYKFQINSNLLTKTKGPVIDEAKSTIDQKNNNYLFTIGTLTYQKRLKPEFKQSETLSAKTEGKDDGSYAKLANSLRDISLLQPITKLLNKSYLSPFSTETFRKYFFSSTDSVTPSGDTLFKVTFIPKAGKFFDGFSGTAVINAKNLAIQQISAQSTQNDQQAPLLIINQHFEQFNGFWLPSETKIMVLLSGKNINNQDDNLIAESTSSNYQQEINPPLSPADFEESSSQLLAENAIIADNQNQQAKMIRLMAEGKVSLGYFNLDYNKIFGYNLFEGIKLGLGGETNSLFSHHFTIGGYISYGIKDKSIRHGEWINIYPKDSSDLRIHLGYKDMNLEFGGPEFPETRSLLNPESYRTLLIKNMFATKRYSTGLEFRPFNDLSLYLFGDISENKTRQSTPFLKDHPFTPIRLARTGFQLKYTPGIKLKMEEGRDSEITTSKTYYFMTIIQGLTIFGGKYSYTKLELKGKFDLPFSKIGTTTIMVRGGTLTQNAPIIELFNGYGSFAGTFSLAAPYSFGTMQLNEFAAANYTAIHIRHNFSTWMFTETMQKRPAFIFAQNIGFGRLSDQYITQLNLTDYRKGFYESGFEINNLFRLDYLSWGAGIYYRYGPYRFSQAGDNFAYKFGFIFKL